MICEPWCAGRCDVESGALTFCMCPFYIPSVLGGGRRMLGLIPEHLSLPEPPSLANHPRMRSQRRLLPSWHVEGIARQRFPSLVSCSTGERVPCFGEGSGEGLPGSAVDRPVFPSLAPMFLVSSPTCFAPRRWRRWSGNGCWLSLCVTHPPGNS